MSSSYQELLQILFLGDTRPIRQINRESLKIRTTTEKYVDNAKVCNKKNK